MTLLERLPNWQIILLLSSFMVMLVVLAPLVRTRLLRVPDSAAPNTGAFEAFKAIAAFAAFVLAFSLTQVQKEMRDTEELVAREASAINMLDRVFVRSNDPVLAGLRPDVVAYIHGIVEDEWPRLEFGQRSSAVDSLFRVISSRARALEPVTPRQQAVYSEVLKTLDDVSDLRDLRVARAGISLSPLFWLVSFGMVAILVMLAGLMPATMERAFTLGGIAAALGLLMALVVIIDGPFQGDTRVSPDLLIHVLDQVAQRH